MLHYALLERKLYSRAPKICPSIVFSWLMSILYGDSPALFRLYNKWLCLGLRKSISAMVLDCALIAMCKAVSPFLSLADTLARLSTNNCTSSALRHLTAFSNGVSPSYNVVMYAQYTHIEKEITFNSPTTFLISLMINKLY